MNDKRSEQRAETVGSGSAGPGTVNGKQSAQRAEGRAETVGSGSAGPGTVNRWFLLLGIGFLIAAADQGTKLLAVRHLTPGMAQAELGDAGSALPWEQIDQLVAELPLSTQLGHFYQRIEGPCRRARLRCRPILVIDGFWAWRYVENPGAAWGLLANTDERLRVPFFTLVSVGAMIFIFVFYRRLTADQRLVQIALCLVFGGAIGNFVDRLHLSYVIDFIDWFIGRHHWPTFNLADAAISTGVGLLMLDWLREVVKGRSHPPGFPVGEVASGESDAKKGTTD